MITADESGQSPSGTDGSAPVPEPGAFFLVGTGILCIAVTARWRRRPKIQTARQ